MKFTAKTFKLGNSRAVYLPVNVYTKLQEGQEYEFNVYTKEEEGQDAQTPAKLPVRRPLWCERKHKGKCINAQLCGCY